jgi:argininosuccinate synthase
VEIAHKEGCAFVAHGATGKGNDQVRFELTFGALDPALGAIVPWRDPEFYNRFRGRSDLIEYASARGVPVVQTKAKPYSMDENMMHISYEAGILEDPAVPAPADMFRMTVDPSKAPDTPATLHVHFKEGVPCRLVNPADGTDLSDPLQIFLYANQIGGAHGVGRVDVVENRFVGIKSRGVYESPGAEILRTAHIGVEGACRGVFWRAAAVGGGAALTPAARPALPLSNAHQSCPLETLPPPAPARARAGLTLDREVFRLRDTLAARFSDLCYNGFWFSPEMEFILHAVKKSQEVRERGEGAGGGGGGRGAGGMDGAGA